MKKLALILLLSFSTESVLAAGVEQFKELKKRQFRDFKQDLFEKVLLRSQYYRLHYLDTVERQKKFYSKELLFLEVISLSRLCRKELLEQLFAYLSEIHKNLGVGEKDLLEFKEKAKFARDYNQLSPSKKTKRLHVPMTSLKWNFPISKIKKISLDDVDTFHFELENKCEK